MNIDELIKQAYIAASRAYVPYSQCHVGAAILLKNGQVVLGCNIENASYGLTNCAERSCLFSLYSQGYKKDDIEAMALVSDFDGDTRPCGACRQVLSELFPSDKPITMLNKDGSFTTMTTKELLPHCFTPNDLKGKI